MRINKWIRSSFTFKHILTIAFAIVSIVLAMFLFSDTIESTRCYQSFLDSRQYNYSVVIDKNLSKDCYAYYDKTILFSKSKNLDQMINATTLMLTENDHTNNDFLAGIETDLKENEVLISANIAKKSKISKGTVLYSQNIVTTKIDLYVVKDVITDIYGLSENETSKEKGLIIIGKNEVYLSNIKTDYIYFYYTDYSLIDIERANICGELTNINELKIKIMKVNILYSLITIILITIICIISFAILSFLNLAIYKKKKEYGVLNLYTRILIDYIIYYFIMIISSYLFYFLICQTSRISIENIIYLFVLASIICFCFICTMKKRLKGA